jgi:hypothetical protein
MIIDLALADLCNEYRIGTVTLGDRKSVCLVFDEEIKINFEVSEETNSLCIFSYLFPGMTEEKTKQLCKHIMSKNAYGFLFGHVIISYSERDDIFIASQSFDMYDKMTFLTELKKFITIIKEVRSICSEILVTSTPIEHSKPVTW